MEQQTTLGMNRTGIEMSPVDAARMEEGAEAMEVETNGPGYLEVRQEYASVEGLGSVPAPGTLKGMLTSGTYMLTGKRPQVFVDKLGERLAFERAGVRLYDTLLVKCDAAAGLISAEVADRAQALPRRGGRNTLPSSSRPSRASARTRRRKRPAPTLSE